jgi:hypothetical protein
MGVLSAHAPPCNGVGTSLWGGQYRVARQAWQLPEKHCATRKGSYTSAHLYSEVSAHDPIVEAGRSFSLLAERMRLM